MAKTSIGGFQSNFLIPFELKLCLLRTQIQSAPLPIPVLFSRVWSLLLGDKQQSRWTPPKMYDLCGFWSIHTCPPCTCPEAPGTFWVPVVRVLQITFRWDHTCSPSGSISCCQHTKCISEVQKLLDALSHDTGVCRGFRGGSPQFLLY